MRRFSRECFRAISDFLFPIACVVCGTKNVYLCSVCQERVVPFETPLAPGIYAGVSYKDPVVRKLLWHLKYKGDHRIAGIAARLLWNRMAPEFSNHILKEWLAPVVVAVPPSGAGLFRDGTHAEEIARAIAGFSQFAHAPGAIQKIRKTKQQMALPRQERFKNVSGAFTIPDKSVIENRRVVVVDDIVTTGATFAECRRALFSAGAKDVVCLAVAH